MATCILMRMSLSLSILSLWYVNIDKKRVDAGHPLSFFADYKGLMPVLETQP